MTQIKSCTDLEQSKKLAEILPHESADMRIGIYVGESGYVDGTSIRYYQKSDSFGAPEIIDAWSLAALLSVIFYPSLHKTFSGWRCEYYNKEGTSCILGEPSDNPVDACYILILKLHELNLL